MKHDLGTKKSDIAMELANALMRLGKNDWHGCAERIDAAKISLSHFLKGRKGVNAATQLHHVHR